MSELATQIRPRRRQGEPAHAADIALQPTEPLAAPSADVLLEARNITKSYRRNRLEVPVLRDCSFSARTGEITAIVGQSGSGKSTLLHLLGTLDIPDSGEIYFDGRRIDNLSRRQRDRFRNQKLGMIFQFYHLLPEITAYQNVLLPMMIQAGFWGYLKNRTAFRQRAQQLLQRVGLEHRLHHRPSELSGGEMQRAAIARALIASPQILLADEPTGNLDQQTGKRILDLLNDLNENDGLTIVMVTHDESIAAQCHSAVVLSNGTTRRP
ncbi:MAG: lipoprotein-releasing system ATP-binding protein LolD 2 [Pirellulaceae bacterium]|nr:MAG: lipoprotein-releasing system ATP-binding protein LolD 2 [Pirellulaceae bacterium]